MSSDPPPEEPTPETPDTDHTESSGLRRVAEGGAKALSGGARAVAGSVAATARVTRDATVKTARTTVTFGFGFWCAFRGMARLLGRPSWWPFAILPVLIALVAFVYLWTQSFGWVQGHVDAWSTQVFGDVGGWFALLLSGLVIVAAGVLVFWFAFPPFARLVAAPFMALFADRVVIGVSGRPLPEPDGSKFVRWVLRPTFEALVLLLLRIAVMVLGLPLLLIPVVGQILFAAILFPIEAMDLLDWAQSARAVPLNRRLPFLRQNLAACAGLGAGAVFFLAIPIVNVFSVPALLVGAVLLDQKLSPDFPGNEPAPEPDAERLPPPSGLAEDDA